MKNVTIALEDEIHRRARIKAAELGTSLSALVKTYLTNLTADGSNVPAAEPAGVREMPMAFHHDAPAMHAAPQLAKGPDGQPYFVNGKWVWTKDGKPRKPGAMRGKLKIADDFDEWPDGFIDALYGEDTEAANNWWKPFATPPERPPIA